MGHPEDAQRSQGPAGQGSIPVVGVLCSPLQLIRLPESGRHNEQRTDGHYVPEEQMQLQI